MTICLLIGALLYTTYIGILFFMQNRLMFLPHLPNRELEATPTSIGLHYEQTTVHTVDNIQLDGWFIPVSNSAPTLLFFHGNAGNISHRLTSIATFHDLGLNVFIFDYRGYGRSSGKPSEFGVYRDAEAVWQYLTRHRGVDPHRIIVFGRSLGGAIAAWLAARTQPAAIIIESSFTSVPELASKLYPLAPTRLLARLQFNTLKTIQNIRSPLLVIHSHEDDLIPFAHGKALYETAQVPKQFLELIGNHNDGFMVTGKRYIQGLEKFLNEQGIHPDH